MERDALGRKQDHLQRKETDLGHRPQTTHRDAICPSWRWERRKGELEGETTVSPSTGASAGFAGACVHYDASGGPRCTRAASARLRRARRAARGRHYSRVEDQDERNLMSELRERIQTIVSEEPVAFFMKGTPGFVMCGNSERALRALREAGAPVTAINILQIG